MNYDFGIREVPFGRVMFVLSLDKVKMTERIVIGEASEALRQLERGNGEVYYDKTRPLGTFLLTFDADPKRKWNLCGGCLRESYEKELLNESKRWKFTEPANKFLREKYASGEPSAMYAAIRFWSEYLNCYRQNHSADLFSQRTETLTRTFFVYDNLEKRTEEVTKPMDSALRGSDSQAELWYPVKKKPFECVAVHSSFLPVITYYLQKLAEWKYVYQVCKVCGVTFTAKSRHYELCSDKCRKVQAVAAKQEFDARTKGDRLEQLCDATYFYWYNRLRKLKRAKTPNLAKIPAVKEAFAVYRKEAKIRKAQVKRKEMKLSDFSNWLIKQQNIVDKLMENS